MPAHAELDIRVGKKTDRQKRLQVTTEGHFPGIKFLRAAIATLIRWGLHKSIRVDSLVGSSSVLRFGAGLPASG